VAAEGIAPLLGRYRNTLQVQSAFDAARGVRG